MSSSSSARLLRRAPASSSTLPGGSSVHAMASRHQVRMLFTSVARARNLPARRPTDPLDTAPNAVRHRLSSGETFIVRAAPSAPMVRNVVDPQAASFLAGGAKGSEVSTSSLAQHLFPGFGTVARAASPASPSLASTSASGQLPPALKPRTRRPSTSSSDRRLTPEQIDELRSLRLSTAATSTPGSDTSVRALAERFGVSPTFVRIIAPLPTELRNAKLAEEEERVGREFWGFNKRLARFERRVRRELW